MMDLTNEEWNRMDKNEHHCPIRYHNIQRLITQFSASFPIFFWMPWLGISVFGPQNIIGATTACRISYGVHLVLNQIFPIPKQIFLNIFVVFFFFQFCTTSHWISQSHWPSTIQYLGSQQWPNIGRNQVIPHFGFIKQPQETSNLETCGRLEIIR